MRKNLHLDFSIVINNRKPSKKRDSIERKIKVNYFYS